MNKKIKTAIAILLIIFIAFMPVAALAHGGKTDGAGGHHDYKNKSGLGSYHYHHGYGPHLHPNGVCPYSSNTSYVSTAVVNPDAKKAVITSGNVKINGNTVNNASLKYPLISHNNITYFPLTYRNKVSLGLTSETKNGSIYFTTGNSASYTADIAGTSTTGKNITATKMYYGVYINGSPYVYDTSWPLLKYNDIVYIPMTYSFAKALDLDISWTQETGLSVSSKTKSAPAKTQTAVQTVQKPVQQTVQITEPAIQFQPINPSARPVLNKNAVYYVYSLEQQTKYLGTVSANFNAADSIFNMTGIYGKYDAETSIWNMNTRYGSIESEYSAMNMYATRPPVIVDRNGNPVGLLTLNYSLDSPALPVYTPSGLQMVFTQPNTTNTTQNTVDTPAVSASSKLNKYSEYYIYSDDGKNKYLGKITNNQFDSESIWNEFGEYGNDIDIDTIWCNVGTYGGSVSMYSSSATLATHPPKIYDKNGNFVAYLTENTAKYPSYTKTELAILFTK